MGTILSWFADWQSGRPTKKLAGIAVMILVVTIASCVLLPPLWERFSAYRSKPSTPSAEQVARERESIRRQTLGLKNATLQFKKLDKNTASGPAHKITDFREISEYGRECVSFSFHDPGEGHAGHIKRTTCTLMPPGYTLTGIRECDKKPFPTEVFNCPVYLVDWESDTDRGQFVLWKEGKFGGFSGYSVFTAKNDKGDDELRINWYLTLTVSD